MRVEVDLSEWEGMLSRMGYAKPRNGGAIQTRASPTVLIAARDEARSSPAGRPVKAASAVRWWSYLPSSLVAVESRAHIHLVSQRGT